MTRRGRRADPLARAVWRALLPATLLAAAWFVAEIAWLYRFAGWGWRAGASIWLGTFVGWCELRWRDRAQHELVRQLRGARPGPALGLGGALALGTATIALELARALARASLPPEGAPAAAGEGLVDFLGLGLAAQLATCALGARWSLRRGDAPQDRARDHVWVLPGILAGLALAGLTALAGRGIPLVPAAARWTVELSAAALAGGWLARLARRHGTDVLPVLPRSDN